MSECEEPKCKKCGKELRFVKVHIDCMATEYYCDKCKVIRIRQQGEII